jgi:membrane-associated phospholipid phosphatase
MAMAKIYYHYNLFGVCKITENYAKQPKFVFRMQSTNNLSFYKANIISFFAALIITGFSIMIGKNNFFLLLNTNLGSTGDIIFKYATYIGDGVVWAVFAICILIFNKKKLPLTLAAIIISTLIAHYIKGHLIPANSRPISAMPQFLNFIHTISGVEISYGGSFPSGHTTQAFSMYLLFCILINKQWIVWVGFFLALLVGYSRVYQAQHFPIDIAGGIMVGLVSAWLSLLLQQWVEKKFYKKQKI